MKTLNRRNFIKTTSMLSLAPHFLLGLQHQGISYATTKIIPLAESLLRKWCRALLEHQINNPNDLTLHGGIYSSGDKGIPGRCADAVYPFLWMAKYSGNSKYIEAAKNVYNWEQHNCSHESGAWCNDPGAPKSWKGITVFGAITKMETINHYSDLLGEKTVSQWKNRTQKAAEWIFENIDINFGNINYPATTPYAMHLAGEMFNKKKYTVKAKKMANEMMCFFTTDNLLYGEGGKEKNEYGLHAIDLGYNVEESLQAMALYAHATENDEMLGKVIKSLKTHLEFMLPNGIWDNSWGTRNFKWTVWGSRTSDGCHPAYYLFADKEPVFAKAVYQNLCCLEKSTHDNVLSSGFHEQLAQVKSSIHHTFEHAKSLTTILNMSQPKIENVYELLPREREYGIKKFESIKTTLFSKGNWRGTVTGYNYDYKLRYVNTHCSGGALSCFYHTKLGLITAASMTEYQRIEGHNMLDADEVKHFMNLTPRVELKRNNGKVFRNISYHNAKIESFEREDAVVIKTESKLVDSQQNTSGLDSPNVNCEYKIQGDTFFISIKTDKSIKQGELKFYLPIVSSSDEKIEMKDREIVIKRVNGNVRVKASQLIKYDTLLSERVYNFIPGVQAFSLQFICNQLHLKPLEIQFCMNE